MMGIRLPRIASTALRDHVARALCESFYQKGHIYEATREEVIEARWREWRPQAEAAIAAIDAWGGR